MMDAPELRIGWLKMFLRVLHGTGGGGTYAELIEFCERNVADAQRELAANAPRPRHGSPLPQAGSPLPQAVREPSLTEAGRVRERA